MFTNSFQLIPALLARQARLLTNAVVFTALFLVSACAAPTQTIEQSRDLSSSGLAYTQAVNVLVDSTTDRLIDFDTASAIKVRRGQSASQLSQMLGMQNDALTDQIAELEKFKRQSKLLQAYFLNLQALADSPVKDDVGGAVKALSGSMSQLNSSLGNDFTLTSAQQNEIGALAGLVAQSAQASKLKNALSRDAQVIATQLALHEQQLGNIAGILEDRFNAENDLFYAENVEQPYSDMDQHPKLGKNWRSDREQYLRTRFTNQQLQTAQEAARQMRGVWTDILQGRNDVGSIRILISDLNEFLVATQRLKTASENN